ncbi:unnamed protein product [Polarella glacialis]|uniref:SnoaL-like domain-containing protein n=1 Tax=Polarella glacialis TaxID=89957 RepID=A0A813HIH1_POLGL|nr:unnamed protein product [Polarella glacialis]|mmetsp:Transcript_29502/g.47385  ORF Transcript_29502/g.47385 Transcript_29502/m.47385 type:complete len:157 (+) Transcript_29502:110-580(+)|eukprot:CAMPEP_0115077018 /NCGR_PEP_ID=MMETSP0227-20121206/16751_1 /TAXON_ID=89957 /ORGANISM="Polarella glacialis, Strain CCMP 1383" /LENGTH=156 /DNA_ID=CAMNT_0002464227 /DNA_START=138 /DNA_END=608 /DNA_ORIENTATION=-
MDVGLASRRKATVSALFASYSSGAWDEANLRHLAPECVWEVMPRSVRCSRSRDEHRSFLAETMKDFTDFSIVPSEMSCDGEVVHASCRSAATHRIIGKYGQDYAFTLRFAPGSDTTIVHVREFVDSLYSAGIFGPGGKIEKMRAAAAAKEPPIAKL